MEGKKVETEGGRNEGMESGSREGFRGVDEESKGGREAAQGSRDVQNLKDKNMRTNKYSPSVIQMTEIPYQQ